jgi:hypothetical protein
MTIRPYCRACGWRSICRAKRALYTLTPLVETWPLWRAKLYAETPGIYFFGVWAIADRVLRTTRFILQHAAVRISPAEQCHVEAVRPPGAFISAYISKIGAVEAGSSKVRSSKVCASETCSVEARSIEGSICQLCAVQPSLPQVSVSEIGSLQRSSLHTSSREIRMSTFDATPPAVGEPRFPQICVRQVELILIAHSCSTSEDLQHCLDIGSTYLQPRSSSVDRQCWTVYSLILISRNRRMSADEGGENRCDGVAVVMRVFRYPLQGIESAQTDVYSSVTHLINRAGKAIGDLAFAVDLDLAPSRDRTRNHQQAGYRLEKSGPDSILQLRLCLLQLDACVGGGYCLQFRFGETRIQQVGNYRETGERDDQQTCQAQHQGPTGWSLHERSCFYGFASCWKPPLGGSWTPHSCLVVKSVEAELAQFTLTLRGGLMAEERLRILRCDSHWYPPPGALFPRRTARRWPATMMGNSSFNCTGYRMWVYRGGRGGVKPVGPPVVHEGAKA